MTSEQKRPTTAVGSMFNIGLGRARRQRSAILAGLGLCVLLTVLAAAIVSSQEQSRKQLRTNFALRAASSATLVSTYLAEQAQRQRQTATHFLAEPRVSVKRVDL
ncbi:MAG: hypothetical protein ACYDHT_13135, partial [Solirubrobacteraceae bacterium]